METAIMTTKATINVGVSSHYREASYNSEITTQGLLGEEVEVVDHQPLFSRIIQADGYSSWISTDQLSFLPSPVGHKGLVTSHFTTIFQEKIHQAPRLRDGVIGCTLTIDGEDGNWYRVCLPDHSIGWVEKNCLGTYRTLSPENLVQQAKDFLGYQYTWGGISPKGFDCSGLIQTVFRLCSTELSRDSIEQQRHNFLSKNYNDALPGDLLFFGKTKGKVSHVALCIGRNRFIHASGWVRENSFNPEDPDFSQYHIDTFISVNRYLSK
ncbi:NlpC/P60 family protein [Desulforhopalus sp. IMCC35007]|nr:NlpC/P60 family protein [Desulforhopalus sp. IMCC35007]